jgi:hypothetical protein
MGVKMDLVEKYLGEAKQNHPYLMGWDYADERTKDIPQLYDAVYMRRYHGYDLTILYRDGKWIPVHGGKEMKATKNAKAAGLALTKYVDKLPDSSKIIGDMGR